MAITHPTTIRNGIADYVVDQIDAGAGAGDIQIATTAFGTILATLACSDPAAGNAASGVATFNAITDDSSADATGTAAVFRIRDSDTNEVFQGTVTATGGGGDMELSSISIVATDIVSLNGTNTYTAPS